jgi:hypothetical protein
VKVPKSKTIDRCAGKTRRADCSWGLLASFIEQASGNAREEAASDQLKDRVGLRLKASLEEGSNPAGGDWGKSSRLGIAKVTAKPGAVRKRAGYMDGCA